VVTATQQRAAAGYLAEAYRISERRASRVLGRARSTVRYRPRQRAGATPLIRAIRRLARRHRRYGYKRIHARLVHQGWRVNRKCVRRLWNELGSDSENLGQSRRKEAGGRGAARTVA
jgi:putative transposase